jgi:hypothetical protein
MSVCMFEYEHAILTNYHPFYDSFSELLDIRGWCKIVNCKGTSFNHVFDCEYEERKINHRWLWLRLRLHGIRFDGNGRLRLHGIRFDGNGTNALKILFSKSFFIAQYTSIKCEYELAFFARFSFSLIPELFDRRVRCEAVDLKILNLILVVDID